jgi:hypothetical protein
LIGSCVLNGTSSGSHIWDRKGRGNKTLEDSKVKQVKRVLEEKKKKCVLIVKT